MKGSHECTNFFPTKSHTATHSFCWDGRSHAQPPPCLGAPSSLTTSGSKNLSRLANNKTNSGRHRPITVPVQYDDLIWLAAPNPHLGPQSCFYSFPPLPQTPRHTNRSGLCFAATSVPASGSCLTRRFFFFFFFFFSAAVVHVSRWQIYHPIQSKYHKGWTTSRREYRRTSPTRLLGRQRSTGGPCLAWSPASRRHRQKTNTKVRPSVTRRHRGGHCSCCCRQ